MRRWEKGRDQVDQMIERGEIDRVSASREQADLLAVYEAATAQLVPPLGAQIRPFDRMRRTRNAHEYPVLEEPELEEQDVLDDIPHAEGMIEVAEQVVENMPVY